MRAAKVKQRVTHGVGDVVVDRELAGEVVVDEARKPAERYGQRSSKCPQICLSSLSAALHSSEGGSLPLATGYELEGASRDLLSGGGNTNDGGNSPSCARGK